MNEKIKKKVDVLTLEELDEGHAYSTRKLVKTLLASFTETKQMFAKTESKVDALNEKLDTLLNRLSQTKPKS
jgi:uncharacterized coiled-coil protein SlyX